MAETGKMFDARYREGWFSKYTQNLGLDIGCGDNPVTNEVEKWDLLLGNTDATYMEGVPDHHFDYVYSSHLLEHLVDPYTALRNWYRILKPSGWLIICVPHRDLYEKRLLLPSIWNADHKHFFLPQWNEEPDTLGLLATVYQALGKAVKLDSLKIRDDGITNLDNPMVHSGGNYTIEGIWRKR